MSKKFKNVDKLHEGCWLDEFSVSAFLRFINERVRFVTKNGVDYENNFLLKDHGK